MHYWGEWPDELFAQVGQAADEIGQFCRRWGRINVTQTKEKYGTARVYCNFGLSDLHDLLWPGYVYIRYPKLRWLLTFPFLRPFSFVVSSYQTFIYRLAYKRALKKFPLIREEILQGADYEELLK